MTTDDIGDGKRLARAILTRRALLRSAVAGGASIAATLAVTTEQAEAGKFAQKAVFYRPHPSLGQRCGNCPLFERPHACRSVAGAISPNGWCVIWRDG